MPIILGRVAGVGKDSEGNERQLTASEALALRGPCILGTLTFSDAQQKALIESSSRQAVESLTGPIMFDTGASISCFDLKAAEKLGLVTVGKANMISASHDNHPAPLFAGKLIIDKINVNVERAMGANLAPQGLIALIGRDIMSIGTLFYNGLDGSVTFSI